MGEEERRGRDPASGLQVSPVRRQAERVPSVWNKESWLSSGHTEMLPSSRMAKIPGRQHWPLLQDPSVTNP